MDEREGATTDVGKVPVQHGEQETVGLASLAPLAGEAEETHVVVLHVGSEKLECKLHLRVVLNLIAGSVWA